MGTRLPLSSCPQFTTKQTEILEAEFTLNARPDIYTRDRLAHLLQLSNLLIHVWFQTHRSNLRHRQIPQTACRTRPKVFPEQTSRSILNNQTTRKRKLPFNLDDSDWMSTPWKKSIIIPTPISCHSLPPCPSMMAPQSYHTSDFGARQQHVSCDISDGGANQHVRHRASCDMLMSVDFLSRSSESTPKSSFNAIVRHPSGMPIFNSPKTDNFQRAT